MSVTNREAIWIKEPLIGQWICAWVIISISKMQDLNDETTSMKELRISVLALEAYRLLGATEAAKLRYNWNRGILERKGACLKIQERKKLAKGAQKNGRESKLQRQGK